MIYFTRSGEAYLWPKAPEGFGRIKVGSKKNVTRFKLSANSQLLARPNAAAGDRRVGCMRRGRGSEFLAI